MRKGMWSKWDRRPGRLCPTRTITVVAVLIASWCAFSFPAIAAASSSVAWSLRVIAQPTHFSSTHNTQCLDSPSRGEHCDSYTLLVTNVGSQAANGPVVIADTLPASVTPIEVRGEDLSDGAFFTCTPVPLQCIDPDTGESAVAPGQTLMVAIYTTVQPDAPDSVVDHASIAGGGAPAVATSAETTVNPSSASFGIADFSMQVFGEDGGTNTQAGGHPYELVSNFDLNTVSRPHGYGENEYASPEQLKDAIVELPLGLLGNPLAAPQCPLNGLFVGADADEVSCSPGSRVGVVTFEHEGIFGLTEERGKSVTGLYNMVPETGYPAEFGFTYFGKAVLIYANLVRVGGAYRLRVTAPGVPEIGTDGSSLTFFGDPAARDGSENTRRAFFSNPTACSDKPLRASMRVDSWENPKSPAEYTPPVESVVYPQVTGCELLTFRPTLRTKPTTTAADEPAGYEFELQLPQEESLEAPATPALKDATVTLPPGVSLSPPVAGGLQVCREFGPEGINIEGPEASELGEGARDGSPYHDGQEHTAPGHCPAASTVGSVEITTPVLAEPLKGHVYVAEPRCGGAGQPACTEADAANGSLFGLYLEASGGGAIVKLRGEASVNPGTGQVTTTFTENPQLPFSELILRLKEGPRAPLANPQTCGRATTRSDLVPWSSPTTPDAYPFNSFSVDWDGAGGACPASLPFAPGFSAGTVAPVAGAFSPFTLTLSRGDREQDLAQVAVHTPPGLLGMLSSVTLCGEPQAAAGTCSSASQVGSVTAAVGAGPTPFWVQGGRAYLTGPYKGAPFGLSIVIPAVAGPFNLGNVVVRATINADPSTAALTITSDPLPQIIDGVPLRVRTVNVTADRPGFMFNPTNCSRQAVTATVAGEQGAVAAVSSPFTAEGCAGLPFKTKFTVSTQAKSNHADGASLDVKVSEVPGQANIAKVSVSLPVRLPSRLTTIQHACPDSVFAANPATCDPRSLIGIAKAVSPVLPVMLTGPVYLVSHGGAAFPDLVMVIQGDGVRINVTGSINISKRGITSSTVTSPDAPLRSFELLLPRSPHSALTTAGIPASAHGSLCGLNLVMPTTITGQNGAQIKQNTKIAVTGCPKTKKKASKTKKKASKMATHAIRHGGRGR